MGLARCFHVLVIVAMVATARPSIATAQMPERVLFEGAFHDADDRHHGSGSVEVLRHEDDSTTVQLGDDFTTDDGPDLFVVLSPSAEGYADGALTLGALASVSGTSEYDVPDDVIVADFRSVLIWCEEFSVLFAVAPLERPATEKTVLTASLIDGEAEPAGNSEIVQVGEDFYVVRLGDDFSVRKGGSKRVYLSPSAMGVTEGALDLGRLRRGKGSSEYDVPAGTDLEEFRNVVIFDPEEEVEYAAGALKEPFEPITVASGSFQAGEQNYTGSGTAEIVEVAEDSYVVRFTEDFVVSGGPALSVYLSPTNYFDDAALFMGPLLAEAGAQEYRIPPTANIDDYQSVIIWCDEFSVLFTFAVVV